MRETVVRASLTAVAFLIVAAACAANREREDRARRGERTAPVVAQIAPIGLPRPRPLAEGDRCVGVVSRVIPSRQSESQGYWGCFDPGEIDRAFSPGIVSSLPILLQAPTSVIGFDSTEFEHRGDPVERSDEDSDP